jgi:hypothetical protein
MRGHKMAKLAVRGYTQKLEKKEKRRSFRRYDVPLQHNRILVFSSITEYLSLILKPQQISIKISRSGTSRYIRMGLFSMMDYSMTQLL